MGRPLLSFMRPRMHNFQKLFSQRFGLTIFSLVFCALAISLFQPIALAQQKDVVLIGVDHDDGD